MVVDLDKCHREFRVGDDQIVGVLVGGDGVDCAFLGLGRIGQARKLLPNAGLELRCVEVAHSDHRHQIGPVPLFVKAAHGLGGRIPDHIDLADGQAGGIAGIAQEEGQNGFVDAPIGVLLPQPLLFQHNTPLQLHLFRLDGCVGRPIDQHGKGRVHGCRVVHGEAQHIDCLVEGGVGVDVRAEGHPHTLKEIDEGLFGEIFCAVEEHMLQEVGQPLLVFVLLQRTGVDSQPKLGPVGRFCIGPHVIGQPVVQLARADGRIDGDDLLQPDFQRAGCVG